MRCYICNSFIQEPTIDPRDGSINPCPTCMGEISDTLEDYDSDNDGEDADYE